MSFLGAWAVAIFRLSNTKRMITRRPYSGLSILPFVRHTTQKRLLRKTFMALFCVVSACFCASAQLQHIPLRGTVMDWDGYPVGGAKIELLFNGHELAETVSAPNGSYRFAQTYYGEVREVNVKVESGAHKTVELENIRIDNTALVIKLKSNNRNGIVIYGHKYVIHKCYEDRTTHTGFRGMYRSPWGTFSYYKPGWDQPVVLYNKMYHGIRVVDRRGNPIPQAKVRIRYQGEAMYWGETDSLGQLALHIQFATAARGGNVRIEAPHHHRGHKIMQTFDSHNYATYTLRKKKR